MSFFDPAFLLALLVALTVHEWAHAETAFRLGDSTADMDGRRTLNPLAHLDPIGTLLFFLIGIGWAKPVPVDPRSFRHPKRDGVLTALAGPASNLVIAVVAFIVLAILMPEGIGESAAEESVAMSLIARIGAPLIHINILLMAFNMLPIAPLDGSKIIHIFIPWQYEDVYHRYLERGPWILIGLLLAERILGIPLIMGWINAIMQLTWHLLETGAALFA